MSIGWFDAFRENGAPTWYGENRTPVFVDLHIAALLSLFITPTLAFLIILPGIRHLRAISTFIFLFSMGVGAVILISIHYPCWHLGHVHIHSTYKAFSMDRLNAVLGVKIGLQHVNITMTTTLRDIGWDQRGELNYNERFEFADANSVEMERALQKGLPYPILKVVEYLNMDGGFTWGKEYRLAGYYAYVLLWFAFALWLLQMVLLCFLPHYFAHLALMVGVFTLLADVVYVMNTPKQLLIRFPGPEETLSTLVLYPAHCFYATLAAGFASVVVGSLLWLIQAKTAYVFQTFLSAHLDEMCSKKPLSCVTMPPSGILPNQLQTLEENLSYGTLSSRTSESLEFVE